MTKVEIAAAVKTFREGFMFGADPSYKREYFEERKDLSVDRDTLKHWETGFDQGRAAAKDAVRVYTAVLEIQARRAVTSVKIIEAAEDERILRQLQMLAEHPPTNHLLYPVEEDDECPNCHMGTVEQVKGMEDVYVCRGECAVKTAHRHQGKFIGDECCWEERLRASE